MTRLGADVRDDLAYIEQELATDDKNIFSISRVQLQFQVSLTAMTVSNNTLIMALTSGKLLRLNLANPQDIDDLEITRKTDNFRISRLFQDTTGHHLIISTDSGDNFYVNSQWTRGKSLARLKGCRIRSIAWNKQATLNSTKEILIGLDNGIIFESYIETAEEYFKRDERYLKQLYLDPDGNPIIGLHSGSVGGRVDQRFVLVATPSKISFIFGNVAVGYSDPSPVYSKLFEQLFSQKSNFQEFSQPRSDSCLAISPDLRTMDSSVTSFFFAWTCGSGIFYGDLKTQDISLSNELCFSDAKLLPYSALFEDPVDINSPLAITASKYHILVVHGNVVTAVNRLNDAVIYQGQVPKLPGEKILGFVSDTIQSTYWIYTAESIYEVVVSNEERDIWRIFLQRKAFASALKLAKTESQKDLVLMAEADDLLEKQSFAKAATLYAQTTKPFDEVTLSFLQYKERDALCSYLVQKLSHLKRDLFMQRTMVATWVLEIFLTKMNELDEVGRNEGKLGENNLSIEQEQARICGEFKEFVTRHQKEFDIKTAYNIINSFARPREMFVFANIVRDYDYLLSYLVRKQDWKEALTILNIQSDFEIFYKYAMVLLIESPRETIDILMRQNDIDPKRLIPALLRYNEYIGGVLENNEAIRYLNFVINKLRTDDSSIHNTLISIYAKNPSGDENALLDYLQSQSKPLYDLDFALRLCIQFGHFRCCVHVYSSMCLFERGVDMALKYNDIELAIQVAEQIDDDDATRKKLWLRIAQKVICGSEGIKTAIDFIKRCSLLKIEDLVPFFPDFVVIDDFKDEVCTALEDYSNHIEQLRREMDDSVKSAEHIQLDIAELNKRYAIIQVGERCFHCHYPLLTRQFYVFPCQHTFHADCLIARVSKGAVTSTQRKRICELNLEISQMAGLEDKRRLVLLEELENLVAAECILCGNMAIRSIDEPFIGTSVAEREIAATWAFD